MPVLLHFPNTIFTGSHACASTSVYMHNTNTHDLYYQAAYRVCGAHYLLQCSHILAQFADYYGPLFK